MHTVREKMRGSCRPEGLPGGQTTGDALNRRGFLWSAAALWLAGAAGTRHASAQTSLAAPPAAPASRGQPAMLGSGRFTYEASAFGDLPDGASLGNLFGVAVDRDDNVYVGHLGDHPVVVFDRRGKFLRSWGEHVFTRPHGFQVGPDGAVYVTDSAQHFVRKSTPDGRELMALGAPGQPAPFMSNKPFNQPTHTALSPQGDIYVSDGYGNACIHKYSREGRHLTTWGRAGRGPGEFSIPHNICCDREGHVYVADRENHRIQVFDGEGVYLTEFGNVHGPCGMALSSDADQLLYVGEVGPETALTVNYPNLGPRVSVLDRRGNVLARLGNEGAGPGLNAFIAPHGVAVDSRGDIYVAEVSFAGWPRHFPDMPTPANLITLRKLRRVAA